MNIELIETLIHVLTENPQLSINGDITLDIIIGYAAKLHWQLEHEVHYDEQRELAWDTFYHLSPADLSTDIRVERVITTGSGTNPAVKFVKTARYQSLNTMLYVKLSL